MKLKALLICEDIRLEVGGTITLVGVFNERMFVPPGEGAIEVPKLAFFAALGGLRGVEQIGVRQWFRRPDDEPRERPMTIEPHEPDNDEHSFVLVQAPMMFPGPGEYEAALDVEVGGRQTGYRYRFTIERRPE